MECCICSKPDCCTTFRSGPGIHVHEHDGYDHTISHPADLYRCRNAARDLDPICDSDYRPNPITITGASGALRGAHGPA